MITATRNGLGLRCSHILLNRRSPRKLKSDAHQKPARTAHRSPSYRKETDILGQWIAERCELDPTALARQADLFNDYVAWMGDENYRGIGSRTAFGRKLEGRGFPRGENEKGRIVHGLRLKTAGDSW